MGWVSLTNSNNIKKKYMNHEEKLKNQFKHFCCCLIISNFDDTRNEIQFYSISMRIDENLIGFAFKKHLSRLLRCIVTIICIDVQLWVMFQWQWFIVKQAFHYIYHQFIVKFKFSYKCCYFS